MGPLKTVVSAAALAPFLLSGAVHAAKPASGQGDAQSCAALTGKTVAPNTVIQSADYLAEAAQIGTTKIARALLPGDWRRHPDIGFPYRL